MQMYCNKRTFLRIGEKKLNSHRIGLGHKHGRRFIFSGHQYGRRDVTWPGSMQIYWNKRNFYIRKRFNSDRIGMRHQHGRRVIVLVHQYGRRDVMSERSKAISELLQASVLKRG